MLVCGTSTKFSQQVGQLVTLLSSLLACVYFDMEKLPLDPTFVSQPLRAQGYQMSDLKSNTSSLAMGPFYMQWQDVLPRQKKSAGTTVLRIFALFVFALQTRKENSLPLVSGSQLQRRIGHLVVAALRTVPLHRGPVGGLELLLNPGLFQLCRLYVLALVEDDHVAGFVVCKGGGDVDFVVASQAGDVPFAGQWGQKSAAVGAEVDVNALENGIVSFGHI